MYQYSLEFHKAMKRHTRIPIRQLFSISTLLGIVIYIFSLYRIAHYTDQQSGPSDILDYHGHKAICMVFQRKIDGQRIEQEVKKAIRDRVSAEEWKSLRDTATTFCKPYATGIVDRGDVYTVAWDTQGWLISQFNGQEISRLHDDRFARALWSIWVGQESLVNKADLLGGWSKGS